MRRAHATTIPLPGQLWLSRPPYLLIAQILSIEEGPRGFPEVSYDLLDDDGSVLEHVERALVDEGWWRAFQPLVRRFG
jgi:hypothetical protein